MWSAKYPALVFLSHFHLIHHISPVFIGFAPTLEMNLVGTIHPISVVPITMAISPPMAIDTLPIRAIPDIK